MEIKKSLLNSFGYVTAVLFVLILPIGTPHYVVAFGSMFSIIFGKLVFGGFGQNVFNPALVGRAFVMMSYASKLQSHIGNNVDAVGSATPTTLLSSSNWIGASSVSLLDAYLGFYKGSIGETFALAIIIIGVVLVIRRIIDWRLPLFYVGTCFLIALFVAIFQELPPIQFALLQIGIGGLLFGAVFMLTDPVTSPTSQYGKVVFAIGAAFFTMLFRYKSNMPEGVLYSILIMNMLTPMIDKYTIYPTSKNKRNKYISIVAFILLSILVIVPITNISFGITYNKFKNSTVSEVKEWCDSTSVKSRRIECKFNSNNKENKIKDSDIISKDPVKPSTIIKRNTKLNFEVKN